MLYPLRAARRYRAATNYNYKSMKYTYRNKRFPIKAFFRF